MVGWWGSGKPTKLSIDKSVSSVLTILEQLYSLARGTSSNVFESAFRESVLLTNYHLCFVLSCTAEVTDFRLPSLVAFP